MQSITIPRGGDQDFCLHITNEEYTKLLKAYWDLMIALDDKHFRGKEFGSDRETIKRAFDGVNQDAMDMIAASVSPLGFPALLEFIGGDGEVYSWPFPIEALSKDERTKNLPETLADTLLKAYDELTANLKNSPTVLRAPAPTSRQSGGPSSLECTL